MNTKAVAVKPLDSLNLRSTFSTLKAIPRESSHLTEPMATQPRTLEETMFQMEDIEFNAAQGDLDDLELDHDYFSRLIPTLLRPETPIGAAVRKHILCWQI